MSFAINVALFVQKLALKQEYLILGDHVRPFDSDTV